MERALARRVWLIVPAAAVVPAPLDAGQMWLKQALDDAPATDWGAVVFQGAEWLFLGALTPIAFYLARRFPLDRAHWRRALAAHGLGALALCTGWASLGIALGRRLDRWVAQGRLDQAYFNWLLTSVPWSVFTYFTVLGCAYAFVYFDQAREREVQAAVLGAQLADARLAGLRMQLHPHFLFNSLNTVSVLVREQNTRAASRMLELLGDMRARASACPTRASGCARCTARPLRSRSAPRPRAGRRRWSSCRSARERPDMRVVIVDDEPVARRGLRHLLLEHADVAVVGEARNGEEAVRVISRLAPDLVLLDVQMPAGDGFDVLRRLDPPLPAVIFVTAYDEYAVRAFEAHALDYLVKPVHEDRFRAAIERARERLRSATALEEARRRTALLASAGSRGASAGDRPAARLVIPGAKGESVLDVADVATGSRPTTTTP